MFRLLSMMFALLSCMPAQAQTLQSSLGELEITKMADDLVEPWGLTFLPGGEFLITQRAGSLRLYAADGSFTYVNGTPNTYNLRQGGLLDVVAARDFAQTREIFLTFAKRQGQGAGTALAVARLSDDGKQLENLRVIFEMKEGNTGGVHFGSRVVEGVDGSLFLTMGERGAREQSQNLNAHNGKVVRVNRDGSVPSDNPFIGKGLPEIWSYGHRNPQGAAMDTDGNLYVVEHGARGGDEVNLVQKGNNYGWPVIAYGRHYTGGKIGEGQSKAGMEQPEYYWDPSIAPSGMMIYSGDMFPEWKGDVFVGALKFNYISRLERSGAMAEAEQIQSGETGRVRDVREAPDGSIWFLSVNEGAAYRIAR